MGKEGAQGGGWVGRKHDLQKGNGIWKGSSEFASQS